MKKTNKDKTTDDSAIFGDTQDIDVDSVADNEVDDTIKPVTRDIGDDPKSPVDDDMGGNSEEMITIPASQLREIARDALRAERAGENMEVVNPLQATNPLQDKKKEKHVAIQYFMNPETNEEQLLVDLVAERDVAGRERQTRTFIEQKTGKEVVQYIGFVLQDTDGKKHTIKDVDYKYAINGGLRPVRSKVIKEEVEFRIRKHGTVLKAEPQQSRGDIPSTRMDGLLSSSLVEIAEKIPKYYYTCQTRQGDVRVPSYVINIVGAGDTGAEETFIPAQEIK